MNLEEFVSEKYKTGDNKTGKKKKTKSDTKDRKILKNSNFEAKYQMVLKRIHAVFGGFENDFVKVGTRNKIVCNESAPNLDFHKTNGAYAKILSNKIRADKLMGIFDFIAVNYYKPNPKSERKLQYVDLDILFEDFIKGIYKGPKKFEDVVGDYQENLFECRVRLGEFFETYLMEIPEKDGARNRCTFSCCQKMLECKKEVAHLCKMFSDTKCTWEEISDKIDDIYFKIFHFCEETTSVGYPYNLMEAYCGFDFTDAAIIEKHFKEHFNAEEMFYEEKSKEFYAWYCVLLEYYYRMHHRQKCAIEDINKAEKAMLDYLLDGFIPTVPSEKKMKTDVLDLMKANKWEYFPIEQRETLFSLICKLIDESEEADYEKYKRLNKYIRTYTVDGVIRCLQEIELKLKYPEVYRVYHYLGKLYDRYGDIENAEELMSSLGAETLQKTERKVKTIFEESEKVFVNSENDFLDDYLEKWMLSEGYIKSF